MTDTPENIARRSIDLQLESAGWRVQNISELNLSASYGVAVREMQSMGGPADYILFVDGKAIAAEIVESLEAALEEFRAVEEALAIKED